MRTGREDALKLLDDSASIQTFQNKNSFESWKVAFLVMRSCRSISGLKAHCYRLCHLRASLACLFMCLSYFRLYWIELVNHIVHYLISRATDCFDCFLGAPGNRLISPSRGPELDQ